MGVQEFANHVLANKDKYSPTLVKRANFARNSKKFKHERGGILKAQDGELLTRINNSAANFITRLKDSLRKVIPDWETNGKNIATHKMAWTTDENGKAIVYPEVQEINGKLIDFTRPPYDKWSGFKSAIERRDTLQMSQDQAKWFTENYKSYYPGFK